MNHGSSGRCGDASVEPFIKAGAPARGALAPVADAQPGISDAIRSGVILFHGCPVWGLAGKESVTAQGRDARGLTFPEVTDGRVMQPSFHTSKYGKWHIAHSSTWSGNHLLPRWACFQSITLTETPGGLTRIALRREAWGPFPSITN